MKHLQLRLSDYQYQAVKIAAGIASESMQQFASRCLVELCEERIARDYEKRGIPINPMLREHDSHRDLNRDHARE